jgi:hypothetical protein
MGPGSQANSAEKHTLGNFAHCRGIRVGRRLIAPGEPTGVRHLRRLSEAMEVLRVQSLRELDAIQQVLQYWTVLGLATRNGDTEEEVSPTLHLQWLPSSLAL